MKTLSVPSWVLWILVIGLAIALGALMIIQQPSQKSLRGFVLPEGDAERGKQAFVSYRCVDCHLVSGETFNVEPKIDQPVMIGGTRHSIMTYGKLVNSIIHPSDEIKGNSEAFQIGDGQSLMPDYKEMMTVQELSDLVSFLIGHYEVWIPSYHDQFNYGYPQEQSPLMP